MGKKVSSLGKTYLTLGFIFLYLPINDNKSYLFNPYTGVYFMDKGNKIYKKTKTK